jgi:DNA-binding Lrp family transcriptional regulator
MSFVEIADAVGLDERQVRRIIPELQRRGYLSYVRATRRNRYTVHEDAALGAPLNGTVGALLRVLS